jgi:hypothetical protein
MDEAKGYKTAGAFRTALETRLQTRAREEATDLQRLRRQKNHFNLYNSRSYSRKPCNLFGIQCSGSRVF